MSKPVLQNHCGIELRLGSATVRLDSGYAPVGNGLGLPQPPDKHAARKVGVQVLRYAYLVCVGPAEAAFPST